MKVYVIEELAWEYNDEYFSRPNVDGDCGSPVKAFRSQDNAQAECDRMNGEKARENRDDRYAMRDADGNLVSEFYAVAEVEMVDDDVEGYAEHVAREQAARKKAVESLKAELTRGAAKIFDEFSALESFGWTQYTDYFNDGEPCVFRVRTYDAELNGQSFDGMEQEWALPARNAVESLLDGFANAHLEDAFGDHVRVTVKRDGGVETDSYVDHD